MKNTLFFTAIFILLAIISGCKTQKIQPIPVTTKITVTEKLVPVFIPPDSASIFALFECDSNYNVLLKAFNETKSKGVESSFNFNNGQLNYKAKTIRDTVYIPGKDSIVEKEIPMPYPVKGDDVIIYKQNWLQQTTSYIGIAVIIFGLLFLLIKYRTKWLSLVMKLIK